MGLLLQLLVVTSLFAVLHSAPLENNSESTTVGIRPLPAVISKKNDDSKESDEDKTDIKRVSRETPPQTHTDSKSSQSTTTKPKAGNRPARDAPQHFISGVPTPTSTHSTPTNQHNPSTDPRKVRAVDDPRVAPPPPPPQNCGPAYPPPPPPPPAPLDHPGYPDNRPPPPPPASRPERDVNHPAAQPKPAPIKQTRPAPIPAKVDNKPAPARRPERDTNHPAPQTRPAPGKQTRPAPLPARVDHKPGAAAGHRPERDLSSPGAAASSTTERNEKTTPREKSLY